MTTQGEALAGTFLKCQAPSPVSKGPALIPGHPLLFTLYLVALFLLILDLLTDVLSP